MTMISLGTVNAARASDRYNAGDLWTVDDDGNPTGDLLALVETWASSPARLIEAISPLFVEHGSITVESTWDPLRGDIQRVSLESGGWDSCEYVIATLQNTFAWTLWRSTRDADGPHVLDIPAGLWLSESFGMIGVLATAQLRHATAASHSEILWGTLKRQKTLREAAGPALEAVRALAATEAAVSV